MVLYAGRGLLYKLFDVAFEYFGFVETRVVVHKESNKVWTDNGVVVLG